MFGERDRLRRALEAAGFSNVHEEDRIVAGRWASSVEEYWEQFTEVAAPSARSSTNSRPKKWLKPKPKSSPPSRNSGTARN